MVLANVRTEGDDVKILSRLALVLCAVTLVVGLAACTHTNNQPTALSKDANRVNSDLGRLQAREPLPNLNDSADLRTQNYLYTAEADPNKIWYLVTISQTGQALGNYTIRGPVVPASDQVTNPTQLICQHFRANGNSGCDSATVGLAEPNGIYPGNTNDHLAITTSGAILRWDGFYQVSDQPISLKTPVTLSLNENVAPSHTDLSTSTGGKLPPRG